MKQTVLASNITRSFVTPTNHITDKVDINEVEQQLYLTYLDTLNIS